MSDIASKIAKLLNQSENAGTKEEADAFLSMAQNLSTRYSIDLAVARSLIAKNEKREAPERREIDVAEYGKNTKKHMINLYSGIAQNNDIKIDIAHNSSRVYPYGFPSDLDVAETLFIHLAAQMIESSNEYIRSGEYKKETIGRWVRRKDEWGYWTEEYVSKPIDGRTARSNFYQEFVFVVSKRLRDARTDAESAVLAETEGNGTELVLFAKRTEVNDFYRSKSNARGSWSGASSSQYSSSARSAGANAGESARLTSQGSVNGGRIAINA